MKGKWMTVVLSLALAAGLFGVLPAERALAATTYTWNQTGSASWTVAGNWTPTRTTPAVDDVLIIDGAVTASPALTNVPTQTIGQLKLINNANATFTSAASATLTIGGGAGIDFDIGSGSNLILSGSSVVQISLSAGTTGSISGSMTVTGGAHRLISADASGITLNSGASFTTGTSFSGNAFGSGTANSVVFASGSTYMHNAGSNPFALTAPSSVVVFQSGSTAVYRTTSGYSASGRTFANLTVQNNTALSGTGAADFQFQTLTVESGSSFTHSGSSTSMVTIKGDISSAGTGNVSITSGSGGILVNGGTTQTFGGGGGSGTVTFGSALTVASGTTLAASRTLTTSGGATINGSFQLNSNGFATGGTWTYGSGATLVFNNTGSRYGVSSGHVYWPTTSGPTNVTIANTGGVQMNVSRTIAGTLTASAATSLELNNGNTLTAGSLSVSNNSSLNLATATTGTTGALTVSGNVSVGTSGGLTLNSADLYVGGNWSNSGTFTPNSKAVFFNGTGTQTITKTGGETFSYLIVNKTAGSVQLVNGVTVNATSGDVLQLLNAGGIDLSGNTLTLSGAGGNVLASGAERSITGGTGSTVAFVGSKAVTSASSGTLSFGSDVLVTLSAGVNFGASLSTVNGTLRIDGGGFVNTNAPTYGSSSLLQYYSGGTYGRGAEWTTATSGPGYPANVQVSNNTTLNYPNGSTSARSMAGNLTIDTGSAFYMDYSNPGLNNALTVGGGVTINGAMSLGDAAGGDLKLAGNWTNNGTFNHKNRAVRFNGTGTQTIGGSSISSFFDVFLEVSSNVTGPGGTMNVAGNWTNNGAFTHNSGAVRFNGTSPQTIGGSSISSFFDIFLESASTVTGPGGTMNVAGNWTNNGGTFTPSSSTVVFNGSTAQTIGGTASTTFNNLTLNNTAGASLDIGQTVNGTLTLTNGRLTLGSNSLTLGSSAPAVAGTLNSSNMVVAEGTGALCKQFTADGSYGYPIGDNNSGADYSPVTFTPTGVSGLTVCFQVVDAAHPNKPATPTTDYLTRYWSGTTSAGSFTAYTGVFTFINDGSDVQGSTANMLPKRWTGAFPWYEQNNALSGATFTWNGGAALSDFTAFKSGILAVTLADFFAQQVNDHVRVTWETASELGNVGFNLYRGTSPAGPDRRLNDLLIPSQSLGNPGGFTYTWDDSADLVPGTTYYYWVEDVDVNGAATRHGPVSVDFVAPTAVTVNSVSASPAAGAAALPWLWIVAAAGAALGAASLRRHG